MKRCSISLVIRKIKTKGEEITKETFKNTLKDKVVLFKVLTNAQHMKEEKKTQKTYKRESWYETDDTLK